MDHAAGYVRMLAWGLTTTASGLLRRRAAEGQIRAGDDRARARNESHRGERRCGTPGDDERGERQSGSCESIEAREPVKSTNWSRDRYDERGALNAEFMARLMRYADA
jgi:hypothetical protein